MPLTYKDRILKEQCDRDLRYYVHYDSYRPNYNITPVTSKFYSKYEYQDLSIADPELVQKIQKFRDKGPKDKYTWPVTENQLYGWFDPFEHIDKTDKRFYAIVKTAEFIKHELIMKKDNSLKKEKFVGIPFKL